MKLFGFGKKNKLGIDIGTAAIKIVELSNDGGRFKLENYAIFETEPTENSSYTGQLSDKDLTWGIKETLTRGRIKTIDAVAAIPSFNTFATVISIPYLSEKDIAKSIPYEARKYIPIPLNEVVLDWSIINVVQNQKSGPSQISTVVSSASPTVDVFIAAVPRSEIKRFQTITQNAGLNLLALDLENSALIRALVGNDLSPIGIINIGGRSTSILVTDGGFERVSHNYEVGGFEITKSIAKSFNVSLKRAEELKRNLGLKKENSEIISTAMSSLVDLIVFETKKVIHNYEDFKKTKIVKIFLIGGLVNMPMFLEYFSGKLGLPVSLGNSLARVIYPPKLDQIKAGFNATFTVALGLAMRET